MTDKTFVKITNQQIYVKLCELSSHVQETNGKVKVTRWIATTALTLIISLIFILLGGKLI